jgi:hypothetical protein
MLGEAPHHFIRASRRIRVLFVLGIELEAPHRHHAGSMRPDGLATLDDAADLFIRIHATMALREPRQIRCLDSKARRHRSISPSGVPVAARAEALVQLRSGELRVILRSCGHGSYDQKEERNQNRERDVAGVRLHERRSRRRARGTLETRTGTNCADRHCLAHSAPKPSSSTAEAVFSHRIGVSPT